MTADLAATVAALRDGDRVRATFDLGDGNEDTHTRRVRIIDGRVLAGPYVMRWADGGIVSNLTAVEVLAPALPPEQSFTVGQRVLYDGETECVVVRNGVGDMSGLVLCEDEFGDERVWRHATRLVPVPEPALPPEPPPGTPIWWNARWMARHIEGGHYYPLRSDDRYLYVNTDGTATYNDGLTWADLQPCVPAVPQEPEVRAAGRAGLPTDEPDAPVNSMAVFLMEDGIADPVYKWDNGKWGGKPWSHWTDTYGAPVAVIPASGES